MINLDRLGTITRQAISCLQRDLRKSALAVKFAQSYPWTACLQADVPQGDDLVDKLGRLNFLLCRPPPCPTPALTEIRYWKSTFFKPAFQYLCDRLQMATNLGGDLMMTQAGVPPDARNGKHGQFYVGYLVDVAMDADSEIVTAVNVLPANGAEAVDAVILIQQEEATQANDVQGLSMDGAGYNGPVLRELTDPEGLNLDVTVPPPSPPCSSNAALMTRVTSERILADTRLRMKLFMLTSAKLGL
jgi:hypothetical protein